MSGNSGNKTGRLWQNHKRRLRRRASRRWPTVFFSTELKKKQVANHNSLDLVKGNAVGQGSVRWATVVDRIPEREESPAFTIAKTNRAKRSIRPLYELPWW